MPSHLRFKVSYTKYLGQQDVFKILLLASNAHFGHWHSQCLASICQFLMMSASGRNFHISISISFMPSKMVKVQIYSRTTYSKRFSKLHPKHNSTDFRWITYVGQCRSCCLSSNDTIYGRNFLNCKTLEAVKIVCVMKAVDFVHKSFCQPNHRPFFN